MRKKHYGVLALVLVSGVVAAAGQAREWPATATQREAILRLMQEQRELDNAEEQIRKARAAHNESVRAVLAEISSAVGAEVVPDLRPDGKVVLREVVK